MLVISYGEEGRGGEAMNFFSAKNNQKRVNDEQIQYKHGSFLGM